MNVAGLVLHGVVEDVIHELDDRTLTGCIGHRRDVFDRLLDQFDGVVLRVVDDVVDHEHPLAGQIGLHHAADIFRGGDDHLDVALRDFGKLLDQKDVGRLADRDRQRVANSEQRQDGVLLDDVARQDVHDLGVEQPAIEFDIGQRQFDGETFQHLLFVGPAAFDEQFAQQLRPARRPLLIEHDLQLLFAQITAKDQQVSQPAFRFEQ